MHNNNNNNNKETSRITPTLLNGRKKMVQLLPKKKIKNKESKIILMVTRIMKDNGIGGKFKNKKANKKN
jgi:hypothetical protein